MPCGLNEEKASVFRRWLVSCPFRAFHATRFTGGPDFVLVFVFKAIAVQRWFQGKKSDWSMSKDSR